MTAREDLDRWWASSGFQTRLDEAIKKHRAYPTITVDDYLAERRAELTQELEGKHLIYLDTKHWVNLRHIVVQSRQRNPAYDEILALLEGLRRKRQICCPVSSTLFEELMKQTDISTRAATARIMDYLSGGVCLQNWLDLAKAEFGRHLCQTFEITGHDEASFPIWTKAGYRAGEHTFEFAGPAADNTALEKAFFDMYWSMTFEQAQAMPGWVPRSDSFSSTWVRECERARQSRIQQRFEDVVRSQRREMLSSLSDTLLPMFALCQDVAGTAKDHVAIALNPIYEGRAPMALPSLEIVAGLSAAIILDSTRKAEANDIEDHFHAAQALPYCDALFCDNFMAQKLRSKPLEFGKVYQTEIGSRPEEIIAYLKRLT